MGRGRREHGGLSNGSQDPPLHTFGLLRVRGSRWSPLCEQIHLTVDVDELSLHGGHWARGTGGHDEIA